MLFWGLREKAPPLPPTLSSMDCGNILLHLNHHTTLSLVSVSWPIPFVRGTAIVLTSIQFELLLVTHYLI